MAWYKANPEFWVRFLNANADMLVIIGMVIELIQTVLSF